MKTKSFMKEISRYFIILTILLMIILSFYINNSIEYSMKEVKNTSQTFLKIYNNELTNIINEMEIFLKNITSKSMELQNIKSGNENERVYASISLKNEMLELLSSTKIVESVVIYDNEYDICLDATTPTIAYNQKLILRNFAKEALDDSNIISNKWNFITIFDESYLYKPIKYNGRIIITFVQTKHLFSNLIEDEFINRTICLVDKNETIEAKWGGNDENIIIGKKINEINNMFFYESKVIVIEEQLVLYCLTSKEIFFYQIQYSMLVSMIIIMSTFLFVQFIRFYMKKQIFNPMEKMIEVMKNIKIGEYDIRMEGTYSAAEFNLLQQSTNQMIDEIVNLKINSYERKIELQNMELNSIQLQLRPHFFLNALTTISSLSGQQKNKEIVTYITALSKNIRYMFQAGFHTVPIKEEIRHVENYFEMQELKYPGCVFYMIDLPKDLEQWKIPQMLIHTFIENEFKYAVSMDGILTVLIKISKCSIENEEYLLIEIEDDGVGYPEHIIKTINESSNIKVIDGSKIGLWSIKKMLKLMYEQDKLLEINNISPYGCMNRILIPQNPIHEFKEGKYD